MTFYFTPNSYNSVSLAIQGQHDLVCNINCLTNNPLSNGGIIMKKKNRQYEIRIQYKSIKLK